MRIAGLAGIGLPGVLLALLTALIFAASATQAWAAGLGRLTVGSGIGQPLRAEIEVTAIDPRQAGTLVSRMATQEEFSRAGVSFNPVLRQVRVALQRRSDGSAIVLVTSARPLNEPYLDLLVELSWTGGRFMRQYTFLLDPPELRNPAGEKIEGRDMGPRSAIVPPAAAPSAPAQPSPSAAPPQIRVTPGVAKLPDQGPIQVKPGDTLNAIAQRVMPADVSLDQTLIALYQANPSAFFGSVHQLRAGSILDVPDQAVIASISPSEARQQIRIQTRSFNEYRARLAGRVRTVDSERTGQAAAGSVTGQIQDKAAPAQSSDQLRLSKTEQGAGASGAGGTALGTDSKAERDVARQAAQRETDARIAALEKNLADLQNLLELKNRQLSELQTKIQAAEAAGKTAAGTITEAKAPAAQKPAAPAASADKPAVSEPSKEKPAAPAAKPAQPAPTAAAKASAAPKPAPKPAASTFGLPELNVLSDLTDNPMLLPGVAGILVLALGYGWYAMRKRRRARLGADEDDDEEGFATNSLFGTTGGQNVDTDEDMFNEDTRDSGLQVHPTEVDPVAEAEVYVAYGREAQAEEILLEALRRQPERQAIRAKLLEIYAGRADRDAFNAIANEMHAMTGGRNEEWPQVVGLGHQLDPGNPLYADGAGSDVRVGGQQNFGDTRSGLAQGAQEDVAADQADELEPVDEAPQIQWPDTGADADPVDQSADQDRQAQAEASADLAPLPDLDDAEPVAQDQPVARDEPAAMDFDFELPTADAGEPDDNTTQSQSKGAQAASDAGFADLGIELPSLGDQPDHQLPAAETTESSSLDFDFSSINLELEPQSSQPAEGEQSEPSASASPEEIATKLELAVAYQEIGDSDGARELLQEVLQVGDASQKARAQELLGKLG